MVMPWIKNEVSFFHSLSQTGPSSKTYPNPNVFSLVRRPSILCTLKVHPPYSKNWGFSAQLNHTKVLFRVLSTQSWKFHLRSPTDKKATIFFTSRNSAGSASQRVIIDRLVRSRSARRTTSARVNGGAAVDPKLQTRSHATRMILKVGSVMFWVLSIWLGVDYPWKGSFQEKILTFLSLTRLLDIHAPLPKMDGLRTSEKTFG